MCKFYSAIIIPTGEVLHDVHTTLHEDLVTLFKLNDNKPGSLARLEYTGNVLDDISTYKLRIDGERPDWLTDSMLEKAESKLHQIVKKRIITGEVELLMGGVYVTTKDSIINVAKECQIIQHRGTIRDVSSGVTVLCVCGCGTIQSLWRGGYVNIVRTGSSVQEVRSGGAVLEVAAGGSVWSVYNGGTVWDVNRGGEVREVRHSGLVRSVTSGGTVRVVRDGGVIWNVESGGVVETLYEGGSIWNVWSGGVVQTIHPSGRIVNDYRANK